MSARLEPAEKLLRSASADRESFRDISCIGMLLMRRQRTDLTETLYYQMHLTACVLSTMNAVATPKVLVLCRNTEAPEFGNSEKEKGKYVPGRYTPQARLNMVGGALSIIKDLKCLSSRI